MNYRNNWAETEDIDPSEKLKDFVLTNITSERIEEVTSDLSAHAAEDKLVEYVHTTNPYDVLENCFVAYDLQNLAVGKLGVDPNLNLQGRELVSAMLDKLGFKTEVNPIGLSQIRENIQLSLNRAESSTQLSLDDISGLCSGMARTLEALLETLFLFYTYVLLPDASEEAPAIQSLCGQYRKKQAKSLGHYLVFLKNLMELVQKDPDLTAYCLKHFQREVPLNRNQIAELRMFTVYRNLLTGHHPTGSSWEMNKGNAEMRLDEMDSYTRAKWEGSWNSTRDSQPDFPRRDMLRRIASFFNEFLNSLEDGIYPKVVVMRTYTVDDYGIRQIAVVDDTDETIFLTDCEFEPFTEIYCHSRTNPIGIEPVLVSKEELDDWGTQSEGDTENQEEI